MAVVCHGVVREQVAVSESSSVIIRCCQNVGAAQSIFKADVIVMSGRRACILEILLVEGHFTLAGTDFDHGRSGGHEQMPLTEHI